jgi:hypothetical protein
MQLCDRAGWSYEEEVAEIADAILRTPNAVPLAVIRVLQTA